LSELKITGLSARAVKVPMRKPLVTGGGTVDVAPLLLLDITAGDVRGSSYVFCYTPRAAAPMARFANQLADLLVGKPLAPRRSTAMAEPAGTRATSPARITSESSRRISWCSRPTALCS
jgi:mandelate racemase